MKRIISFIFTLVVVLLSAISVHAKGNHGHQPAIENLEDKYKEIGATATYVAAKGVPVAQELRFLEEEEVELPANSSLRQIALVRHGEPALLKTGKFSYNQARQFVQDYDSVGIVVPDTPFLKVENPDDIAVFASSINRAKATAQYIFGADREMTVSPAFREFETSMGKHSPNMSMSINFWTTTARIKWMLGIDRQGAESFADARKRARKAAQVLAKATDEKPEVVLVAHGLLNRYIEQNLKDMGWYVVQDGGSGYLSTTILAKIEPQEKGVGGASIATR
ncbi:histidine phosphatase family protein [Pontibacter rugosus]|uniref:Histidine phosphatase family protein n=1 Tax=Pontibacter rugosus TaxID=1745966 RepID=A0ABW3SNG6_9BACT